MTDQHSKLPPSSAARRMACPGSRAMSERYGRNEETEARQEGTLAHERAANALTSYNTLGYHFTIDAPEDMIEHIEYYFKTVSCFLAPGSIHVEERVSCANTHPDMWGTPDAWGINVNGANTDLHVFDFKYGHTPVDAYENWQLLAYACGVEQKLFITDVYLHIIQPRDYVSSSRHKVWHITRDQLYQYRERLRVSEFLASSTNAELKVSAECKYCPARHACPALRAATFGAAEVSYREVPQGLDSRAIGAELKLLHEARDLLDYRITALETEAQHLLMSGKQVDHYELKPSESRLAWKVPKSEILAMGQLLGFDLRKEDVLTPTQAIKAGMSDETVLQYAERKQSLKLTKIDLKNSRAVFSK